MIRAFVLSLLVLSWVALPAQTFYKDVQPIMQRSCLPCHFNGGPAPFEFNTYQDVSRKAKTIAAVVSSGYMPPWRPDTAYSPFDGERYLTTTERALILDWIAKGKKEGKQVKGKTVFETQMVNFTEDLLVPTGKIDVDTNVTDLYRFLVFANPMKMDTTISGIRFNPGNPKIVHHAWVFADTVGFSLNGVETNTVSEFSDLGFPFTDVLTGYLPGSNSMLFPEGTGKRLFAGSNIVVQVHYYSPNGKFHDNSSISFQYAEKQVKRPVKTMLILEKNLVNPPLEILANEITTEILERRVDRNIEVLRIGPHMHARGSKVWVYAVTPKLDTIPLIKINQWDFNWQGYYSFKSPVFIPAGSRIRQEATYDNTERNMNNPIVPPITVSYGLGSLNEMCELAIEYLEAKNSDAKGED